MFKIIKVIRNEIYEKSLLELKINSILTCNGYTKIEIENWINYIKNEKSHFQDQKIFLCKLKNQIIGFMSITINNKIAFIQNFYILDEYQKRGYGKKLINYTEKYLKNKVERIDVRSTLDAVKFYENFGFKKYGTTTSRAGFKIFLLEKDLNN